MTHPVFNPLKVTDRVTVLRSDGTYDEGWYLWTDLSVYPEFAFTAPECIGVMVIKPTNGESLERLLQAMNDGTKIEGVLSKKVSLGDLYTWQNGDLPTAQPKTTEEVAAAGKEQFLKRVDELRAPKKHKEDQ